MSAATFNGFDNEAAQIAKALHGERVGNAWMACCPAHEDHHPSLAIKQDGDKVLLKCHAHCTQDAVIDALRERGLWEPRPVRVESVPSKTFYVYNDEQGKPLHRTERKANKKFIQWSYQDGKWIPELGKRRVLYHLDELIARSSETVYIPEGEKDVDRLRSLGYLCTCNTLGAGKWREDYTETIASRESREAVIFYDNDPASKEFAGQDHAQKVALSLLDAGCRVRIVDLPEGKDVSDYLALGHTKAELDALIAKAPYRTKESVHAWRNGFNNQPSVIRPITSGTSSDRGASWGEPLPLAQALPPVEKFNMDLLPPAFRLAVEDATERMQVPPDLIAIPQVTSLSAVVGRRVRIQPKKEDSQWQVTPNLWGAIIAPPGFLKTPSQRLGTGPLKKLQDSAREGYEKKEQEYERQLRNFDVRKRAWDSNALRDAKNGAPFADFEETKPEPPTVTRYIVNDATEAKLQELLAANPGGVLLERDELSGWLAQLDHPNREGERAFMLEAWEGNGSHHVDRIGRGTTFCDSLCVSVIGGIQPAKFRSYASSMLRDDHGSGKANHNDGLLQRIQLLAWPDMDPRWTYVDRKPNEKAIQQVVYIFEQLSRINPATPIEMVFDADAQTLFVEWLSDLEVNELRNTDQHEAFISHLSKYRSLIPSLAGLFELVEIAASSNKPLSETHQIFITVESLRRAIHWGRYLKTHATRAYSTLVSPQMQAAQALSQKIKAGKLGHDRFRLRSLYQKNWAGLDHPDAARAALAILEDSEWVRPVRQEAQPFRPSEEYDINPKVFTNAGTEDTPA
jgi:DNA primase